MFFAGYAEQNISVKVDGELEEKGNAKSGPTVSIKEKECLYSKNK